MTVLFEDEYYLISSETNGYRVSPDLVWWEFISCDNSKLPNIISELTALILVEFRRAFCEKTVFYALT